MTGTVSIILPVYNQADHIAQIVESYLPAVKELPVASEIILVTNNCRDRSPELCRELEQQYSNVRTVDTKQGGWGHAVNLGIKVSKGDLICYTNSARTQPDVLVTTISYAISHPKTVVKANRKIRESLRRRLGSLLYNLECRALFDLPTWDINGTPKVFPRSCEKLLSLTREDDLVDAEFLAICRREGYPIIEVPVVSTQRHGGKSTTNLKSAAKMYWGAFKLWQSLS